MDIPIYRAKKLDKNEYEIGFLLNNMIVTAYEQTIERDGIYWKSIAATKIDPTTLAIHFPDMLDSEGNKIFASLGEDGKGGDIAIHPDYDDNKYVFIYNASCYEFGIKLIQTDEVGCWEYSTLKEEEYLELFKVIGIQQ